MQLYHYIVPVKKYVQQGIQKNLSHISMITARMPVLMLRWYIWLSILREISGVSGRGQ